ncbi:MAG TPA: hypothetical protein PLY32_04360 [Salinivirgaceae bacterium]|nr:hypothetical protein [Salinivirgaceae bacterium]HQA76335.1 hypothetical protein [Salinivirgaceae bacterium]
MTIFRSKSSTIVKTITIGFVIVLILITIWLLFTLNEKRLLPSLITIFAIILTVLYFYANSLKCIILNAALLIIKKNFGQKTVNLNEITSVERVPNSSLTMTYGTMGVFGFIGSTMDNSYSYVKDRSKMV